MVGYDANGKDMIKILRIMSNYIKWFKLNVKKYGLSPIVR